MHEISQAHQAKLSPQAQAQTKLQPQLTTPNATIPQTPSDTPITKQTWTPLPRL